MKRLILVAVIAAMALSLVGVAGAMPSNKARAVNDVKKEIGTRWPTLATYPKAQPGAKSSVYCDQQTKTQFRCEWAAHNSTTGEEATGEAIVKLLPHGDHVGFRKDECTTAEHQQC